MYMYMWGGGGGSRHHTGRDAAGMHARQGAPAGQGRLVGASEGAPHAASASQCGEGLRRLAVGQQRGRGWGVLGASTVGRCPGRTS